MNGVLFQLAPTIGYNRALAKRSRVGRNIVIGMPLVTVDYAAEADELFLIERLTFVFLLLTLYTPIVRRLTTSIEFGACSTFVALL